MINNEKTIEMQSLEKNMIAALQQGEKDSFQLLADQYGTRLLKAAFLLCGEECDAQDLTQETLYQALKSIRTFQGKSSIYTWLYGILLNIYRQWLRKKRIFIFTGILPNFFNKSAQTFNSEVPSTENLQEIENKMDMEKIYKKIHSLIKTMSSHHREIIILRYFEDMKINEIAELVGKSPGTVKSRLHYATSYLRKKIPGDLKIFNIHNTHKGNKK